MTEDQARIVLLTDELEEAQNLAWFLHGCLTDPGYKYGYPEQTLRLLERWRRLAPRSRACVHSFHNEDCAACAARFERRSRQLQAAHTLGYLVPDGGQPVYPEP